MNFAQLAERQESVRLLQKGWSQGRLAHAYLFTGDDLDELETTARTLAKALTCERPPSRAAGGLPLDCCDACSSCRKVEEGLHPDVLWVRPESKSRQIRIGQFIERKESPPRPLLTAIYVKPTQAAFKVGIISGADRMTTEAANCFLKTLEEPPADTVFAVLSADPQRMIGTIVSRCQRLNLSGGNGRHRDPALLAWLGEFAAEAAAPQKSLLGRYRLLSVLLARLAAAREGIEESLGKRSPLERYDDIEADLRDKWEAELKAAIEAEYRRHRSDCIAGLQWWFRDVWLHALRAADGLLTYPEHAEASRTVAARLTAEQATENLRLLEETQRLLFSNVQEALALEVGLLNLRL